MHIRAAEQTDCEDVARLLPQLLTDRMLPRDKFLDVYRDFIADRPGGPNGAVLLAEDDNVIYGLISLSFVKALRYAGGYAQIEELVVDAAARGKNAGGALVHGAIDAARARGCSEIGLYAREQNVPFYEKYGFSYAGPELRLKLG